MVRLLPIDEKLVERGIYLDFEQALKEEVPQIAGVMVEREYTCNVVDPRLERVAKNRNANRKSERWCYCDAKELVIRLMEKAEDESRRIIGYSTAELETIAKLVSDKKRISSLYYNANMAPWFRKRRKTTYKRLVRNKKNEERWNKKVGLKDILELEFIDYDYPGDLKGYSPSKALSDMMKFLEERKDYKLVPRGAKTRFTKLHRYNFHDCAGMKCLLEYRLSRGDKITQIK